MVNRIFYTVHIAGVLGYEIDPVNIKKYSFAEGNINITYSLESLNEELWT